MRLIDETGNHYGRLVVISRGANNKSGNVRWLCKCSCDNYILAAGFSLRRGDIKSCGCLLKETASKLGLSHSLPKGEASFNALVYHVKNGARKRGLNWGLSNKQAKFLFTQCCYYCGKKPSQVYKTKTSNGKFVYNGIDRKDNSLGYTTENCVSCCGICNRAKNTMTIKEFENWIDRICSQKNKRRK